MKRLLRAAAIAALSLNAWGAIATAAEFDAARAAVREHIVKQRVPGMSVAVWRQGRIVWQEGFGWADLERRIPATEHTMFDVASVTKTMAAVGLMTLVQSGRLELDRSANDYLGSHALQSRGVDANAITLRHLANHTSGLQGGDQVFFGDSAAQVPSTGAVIDRYGFAFVEPGASYRYSNLGYGVLGQVLAQTTGRRFDEFMRQEIFLPLGMTRSSIELAADLQPYAATRYDMDRQPIPVSRSALPAAGSAYASAHDIARFGLFLAKRRLADQSAVLSDASIDAMLRDPVATGKAGVEYGIGLVREQLGGYEIVGHTGSSSGASAYLALVPSQDLGVVLLANANGGAPEQLLSTILQSLLPRWRALASPAKPKLPTATRFEPSPQLIGAWQGEVRTYEGNLPMQLQIFPSGDVHIRIGEARYPWGSRIEQDALVNSVSFADGELTGTSLAQIETSDTKRFPHTASLSLRLRGDVLSGQVTAVSRFDGRWIYALPYWTELRKVSGR